MMTQTHLLVSAAILTKPGTKRRNIAIVAGALLPDLAIFLLFGWAILTGIPQETLWTETYWRPGWQALIAIGNSIPLFAGLFAAALFLAAPKDGRARWQSLPALLALSALLHLAGDFPLHNDDAHIHFWPFSDWRFQSPVSYWDRDYHAGIIAPLEILLGIGLATVLLRRFQDLRVRAGLILLLLAYLAVPVFFVLQLG